MSLKLNISIGQSSNKGRKKLNQDFHGVYTPKEPLLSSKGIAIALADGISSSDVSQEASKSSVTGFLEDYFCTSESWSVKSSIQKVLLATNSWLYAQTHQSPYRFESKDRGYVCTFSGMILKSTTAHIFNIGDTRIYRLQGNKLEQLTKDHRLWVTKDKSYLSRALGMSEQLEIDYKTVSIDIGDTFVLATDGVYEFINDKFIIDTIAELTNDLDLAAKIILDKALEQGSDDNLTIQVIKIDQLPEQNTGELYQQLSKLPFAPILEARMVFDGYKIIREVYASSRSHVYLAVDIKTDTQVIIKTPSVDLRDDVAYLERFLMEEWIARRINNPHVLKPCQQKRQHNFLYIVTEYIEGQTLAQWMIDNPKPDTETVRNIIEQIAIGLQAFHRQEMIHQDLRPNNIMLDQTGTVKIIDFGSTRVAGLIDINSSMEQQNILGTAIYTAPEYFLGESGTYRSDLYSLAVIAYHMLSGKLPYGVNVSKAHTKAAQHKLNYQSILSDDRKIPAWFDKTLKKALHPNPFYRYGEITEFIYDLRHPNKAFTNKSRPPLMEQHPVLFWQIVSFILCVVNVYLLSI